MTMAAFVSGKPIMADYTPSAAYIAGDVLVEGDLPLVAHVDNPSFGSTVVKDALAVSGGIYKMRAALAIAVGKKVYWDAATEKVTTVSVGNKHFGVLLAGPTGDINDAGPAADGDFCFVLHRPDGA